MQQMGEDMGQYVVVTTADPKEPGRTQRRDFRSAPLVRFES
jgi:hypothetical protein